MGVCERQSATFRAATNPQRQGLLVKNTFLDLSVLTDGTDVPEQWTLHRSKTAPQPCASHVSTAGSDTDADDAPCVSVPSSPASSCSRFLDDAGSLQFRESLSDYQQSDAELDNSLTACQFEWRVRNTFVEGYLHEPPLRRTVSMPDLHCVDSTVPGSETLVVPDTPDMPSLGPVIGYAQPLQLPWAMVCYAPSYSVATYESYADSWQSVAEGIDRDTAVPQNGRRRKRVGRALEVGGYSSWDIVSKARQASMDGSLGIVWDLSCKGRESSYAVQEALAILSRLMSVSAAKQDWLTFETAAFDTRALLGELQGRVVEALKHPFANYVIKQLVEVLPTEYVGFVAAELIGKGAWAATHTYGCRTVLRLVRHCAAGGWEGQCAETVISEVVDAAVDLCCDEFAKFVLEEVLANGQLAHQRRVVEALTTRAVQFAQHRHASGLLERLFKLDDVDFGADVVETITSTRGAILTLVQNQFGRFVLKALMQSSLHRDRLRNVILPLKAELGRTRQGRSLLDSVSCTDTPPYS